MSLNTRVRLLRKKLNMSQKTFGNRLGVTGAGISKIESGERKLTEQMLLMICREFHVNENWLRYGKGEIFKEQLPTGMDQLTAYYQLDDLDQRIIYEYVNLEEHKRKVIKEYILRLTYGYDNSAVGDSGSEVLTCAEGSEERQS